MAQDKGSPKVSGRTVQRYLKSIGWTKLVPFKSPYLTARMKATRVQWCKDHIDLDWSNVFFSDESLFQLYRITQRQWEKTRQAIAVPKHSPAVMVWGAMSARGLSPIAFIPGHIDSTKYAIVMDHNLLDTMNTLYPDGWLYQQDNAPVHTSKLTKKWFEDHGVRLITWPPGSTDLNPIEVLWAIIKRRIEAKNPSNVNDLKAEIEKIWEEMSTSTIKSLIDSMPARLQKCIELNGETIKM
ncbi:hypothetical protein B4U79_01338 [Dinothrombium tinctorium]|uniref:Tc1-like transposase DDE domain-containing protein n=1 Tax=Dinothrombium tinctorium TaxID=1965070 RepID=A0A3S4Q6X9_9ACAR|nr:hypothetical protein B4U79_01338 [Dinothrombium tinctorium]